MNDVFFDFSAVYNGDGSVPGHATAEGGAGAYNTVQGVTPASDTTWWLRRVWHDCTITSRISYGAVDKFYILGWPKDSDYAYASRPASGIETGWDDDTNDFAEISCGTSGFLKNTSIITNFILHNVRLKTDSTSTFLVEYSNKSSRNICISSCEFIGAIGNSTRCRPLLIYGNGTVLKDTKIQGSIAGYSGLSMIELSGEGAVVSNVTIETGKIQDSSYIFYLPNLQSATFHDVNISVKEGMGTNGYIWFENCCYDINVSNVNVSIGEGTSLRMGFYGSFSKYNFSFDGDGHIHFINIDYRSNSEEFSFTGLSILSESERPLNLTSEQCTITLKDCDIKTTHSTGKYLYLNGKYSCILAENCLFESENTPGIDYRSSIYSMNHNRVEGAWRGFAYGSEMITSSAKRTGGTSGYSLRAAKTGTSTSYYVPHLYLGVRGVAEAFLVELAAGDNTITMYGAQKIFSERLTYREVWIELDYKDSNGNVVTTTSVDVGPLTDDNSSWENETDLDIWKLVFNVNIPTAQSCAMRVMASLSSEEQGYMYIEPHPYIS